MVKERAFVSMKSTSFILKPCIKSQVFMAVPVAGLFPGTDSACVQTHFTTGTIALQCCVSSAVKQHESSVCTQISPPFWIPFTIPPAPLATHLGHHGAELPVLFRRRSSLSPPFCHPHRAGKSGLKLSLKADPGIRGEPGKMAL